MRGSLDHVYVNYSVTQPDSVDSETPASQDFVNATGAVLFMPGQRSEVCVLCVCGSDSTVGSVLWSYMSCGKPLLVNPGHTESSCSVDKNKCDVLSVNSIYTSAYWLQLNTEQQYCIYSPKFNVFRQPAPPSGWLFLNLLMRQQVWADNWGCTFACGRAHKHYNHILEININNTYIIMFILTFPGRYWTCWCWMITSQSWQSPFRSHWYQQSPVMGSQAPPQPAVQASTQITQLTPSLSQPVTTLMVFTCMPKNSTALLSMLLFIATSSQY